MNLRPATADDVAAVRALEVDLFGADAWSETSVREELLGERRTAVVACDPEVVGYVVTAAAGDVVDLQRVAVREDHRRSGLARRLLRGGAAGRRAACCWRWPPPTTRRCGSTPPRGSPRSTDGAATTATAPTPW